LRGRKRCGKTAAVIGGGLIGCETALWLSQSGSEVVLIEMLPELMSGSIPVPLMNRQMLLDLLAFNKVKIITGALQKITGDGAITIVDNNDCKELKIDTVVLAAGMKSDDALYQALSGKVARLYAVGDCRNPRNIMQAVWDGFEVGRAI